MALDQFRTIRIDLDQANDDVAPVLLNAGDIDGRELTVVVTDNGEPVTGDTITAQLAWNPDIDNPQSAGGYVDMTRTSVDGTIAFETPVPRSLLLSDTGSTTLGIILHDGGTVTATRNAVAIVEPSVLNAAAPDIQDPLKELHAAADTASQAVKEAQEAVEKATEIIDGASITAGTTTTVDPNQQASSSLEGDGLTRRLNLRIPRGSGVADIKAETATPAEGAGVETVTDEHGDKDITLKIPRGVRYNPVIQFDLDPTGAPSTDSSTDENGDVTETYHFNRQPRIASFDAVQGDAFDFEAGRDDSGDYTYRLTIPPVGGGGATVTTDGQTVTQSADGTLRATYLPVCLTMLTAGVMQYQCRLAVPYFMQLRDDGYLGYVDGQIGVIYAAVDQTHDAGTTFKFTFTPCYSTYRQNGFASPSTMKATLFNLADGTTITVNFSSIVSDPNALAGKLQRSVTIPKGVYAVDLTL